MLWTVLASRAAWAVHFGELPVLVVAFRDGNPANLRVGNLYVRPRRARSIGRRGGNAVAQLRDIETLERLAANPGTTVAAIARSTGVGSSNVSRRLRRLSAHGLVEAVCVPGRAHWLLTQEGRAKASSEAESAIEAELLMPHDLNGHRVPWVAPLSALTLSRQTFVAFERKLTPTGEVTAAERSELARATKRRLFAAIRSGRAGASADEP
jgi:DNA-binding MarR family transcriptional regulator